MVTASKLLSLNCVTGSGRHLQNSDIFIRSGSFWFSMRKYEKKMGEPTWEIFDTKEFQSPITSSSAIALSTTNQLAVSTSRGLMILNVIPNPRDQSNHINFRVSLIPQDNSSQSNPVLFRLGQQHGFDEYLSRYDKVENATFILDTALPPLWKQSDGPKNLKQVSSLHWSPPCKSMENKSLLATLTFSHHLQIVLSHQRSEDWKSVVDVSRIWYNYLKQNQWSVTTSTTFNYAPNEQICKLLSKAYLVATTSVCWSTLTLTHENVTQVLLFTGQKSGHVVVWKVKVPVSSNIKEINEGFSVHSYFDTNLGPISYLLSIQPNSSNDNLLFVGGKDGRVKLFWIGWNHESIDTKDLGYVWNEKDNISVGLIKVVSVSSSSDQLVVIIAKEYFVVKLTISVNNEDDIGVKVIKKSVATLGGSNAIALCEVSKDNFVVFSSEGAPTHFKATDKEFHLIPFTFKSSSTLDFKNQSTNGALISNCGNVMILCQNGDLGKRYATGKLLFFVKPVDMFQSIELATEMAPYYLEYIRLKVSDNFDENCYTKLSKIARSKKVDKRIAIWIMGLLESICSRNDLVEELQQVSAHLDKLFVATMIEKAKLLISQDNVPEASKFAPSAYLTNHSKKGKQLIDDWKCKLCGSGMSEKSFGMFDSYICQSGHAWPMCTLSLQVCDSIATQKCSWCDSIASEEVDKNIYGFHCTICGGCIE